MCSRITITPQSTNDGGREGNGNWQHCGDQHQHGRHRYARRTFLDRRVRQQPALDLGEGRLRRRRGCQRRIIGVDPHHRARLDPQWNRRAAHRLVRALGRVEEGKFDRRNLTHGFAERAKGLSEDLAAAFDGARRALAGNAETIGKCRLIRQYGRLQTFERGSRRIVGQAHGDRDRIAHSDFVWLRHHQDFEIADRAVPLCWSPALGQRQDAGVDRFGRNAQRARARERKPILKDEIAAALQASRILHAQTNIADNGRSRCDGIERLRHREDEVLRAIDRAQLAARATVLRHHLLQCWPKDSPRRTIHADQRPDRLFIKSDAERCVAETLHEELKVERPLLSDVEGGRRSGDAGEHQDCRIGRGDVDRDCLGAVAHPIGVNGERRNGVGADRGRQHLKTQRNRALLGGAAIDIGEAG